MMFILIENTFFVMWQVIFPLVFSIGQIRQAFLAMHLFFKRFGFAFSVVEELLIGVLWVACVRLGLEEILITGACGLIFLLK